MELQWMRRRKEDERDGEGMSWNGERTKQIIGKQIADDGCLRWAQ